MDSAEPLMLLFTVEPVFQSASCITLQKSVVIIIGSQIPVINISQITEDLGNAS